MHTNAIDKTVFQTYSRPQGAAVVSEKINKEAEVDRVTISDDARRAHTADERLGKQLRTALEGRPGVEGIYHAGTALNEGLSAIESGLRKVLVNHGYSGNESFSLSYSAAEKRVVVSSEDKALESKLNAELNNPANTYDGVSLRDLVSGVDKTAQVAAMLDDLETLTSQGLEPGGVGFSYDVKFDYGADGVSVAKRRSEMLEMLMSRTA